jgi:uncharacterized protein
MPLIENNLYRAPRWLVGGHAQTMVPALCRKVPQVTLYSERLELIDGDFLDLEWAVHGRSKLAILSHGLEAHAGTEYIQAMAAALVREGWDVLAWTFRGCGKTPNRLLRMYHSGATEDLHAVVKHAIALHSPAEVDLIGFSLGGNLTMKYLGENPAVLPPQLHRAVAFSVPCDLGCSSRALAKWSNKIYMERFLLRMRQKIRLKNTMFPGVLDLSGLQWIRTFQAFDDRYTAPLHGFVDAADYWEKNSCRQFLPAIPIPTLLVNASNDPFLGPGCYPRAEATESALFHLMITQAGGHVGFSPTVSGGDFHSETLALEFLRAP